MTVSLNFRALKPGNSAQASQLETDLADSGNSSKGATLVGLGGTNARKYLLENDTHPLPYKVSTFLKKLSSKACRVLLMGTSIASFDSSAVQSIVPILQRRYNANNRSRVNMLGSFGGNYLPQSGHKKQVYGGSGYYRLVMDSGESDIVFSGFVDSINLVYSKESDGGSFQVFIDGALDSTLTSLGSQSYENVYTKTFTSRGYHTITIKAPSSGSAYLERVEMMQSDFGVFVENATLGGSALANTITLFSDTAGVTAGNKIGIAISGNNGIDAFCGRSGVTAPDLIICEHFTNDGVLSTFQTAIARLVAQTKAAGIPLVLLTEQPALAFVTAGGVLNTTAQSIHDAILAYRNEKHVTVIDWTEMVDFSNKAAYTAKYYTAGVEETHPNAEGAALPMNALCDLFSVPNPRMLSALGAGYDVLRPDSSMLPAAPTDDTYAARYVKPGDRITVPGDGLHSQQMQIVGRALNFVTGHAASAHYSTDFPSLVASTEIAAITGSGTSDASGPYRRLATNTSLCTFTPMRGTSVEQVYTCVVLAKATSTTATPGFVLNTPSTNAVPRLMANGTEIGNTTGAFNVPFSMPTDAPVLVYFSVKENSGSLATAQMNLVGSNMDVYGVWVTEGAIPVITPRTLDKYRQIGFPLYMTGDAVPANVVPGQTYLESINSITVEKVALPSVCWKPLQAAYGCVYEMRNKGTIFCQRISPASPSTLAYRDKAGGEAYNAETNNQWSLSSAFGTFPTGKVFTFGVRGVPNVLNSVRLYFVNGSSNTFTYLKSDGTWASQVGGAGLPTIAVGSRFIDGLNLAFTFTMPDASFATALGANPQFFFVLAFTGSSYFAPAVLAEGSSAIVAWTA